MSARSRKRRYKLMYLCFSFDSRGYLCGGENEISFVQKRAAVRYSRLVAGMVTREPLRIPKPCLGNRKYKRRMASCSFAASEILKWWFGS